MLQIGNSKAPLINLTDPNGIRIELLEYPAEVVAEAGHGILEAGVPIIVLIGWLNATGRARENER